MEMPETEMLLSVKHNAVEEKLTGKLKGKKLNESLLSILYCFICFFKGFFEYIFHDAFFVSQTYFFFE